MFRCPTTETQRTNNVLSSEHETTSSTSTKKTTYQLPPINKRKISVLDGESKETKDLTLRELQRVVLLEQLEVLRLKKAKLMTENENISQQDGMSYRML